MRRTIIVLGPSLDAVSGVSTHLRLMLGSELALEYELRHFQVGSEGRRENVLQKLLRCAVSPLELAALLLRSRAAAVHLNTTLDRKAYWRDLAYAIVAKLLGRRVLCAIHGGALPQDLFRGNVFLSWVLRRSLIACDAVAVLSARELEAHHRFDARIAAQLIPNAIDPSEVAERPRARSRDSPLRLVYVGRIVRAKGLFEALAALERLQRAGRRFIFSIAGDGPDQAALETAARAAGLADCVSFVGRVVGPDKLKLWLESDVFLLPSYAEGLPYALLEAMAAGCVPVATAVGAVPEVVCHGENGLLVATADASAIAIAVAALDHDRNALERMGHAARQSVLARHTTARLVRDLRAWYSSALPPLLATAPSPSSPIAADPP